MKKTFYLFSIFTLATLMFSCSKDDDSLKITSPKNVELVSEKSSQITCSDSKAVFTSENEFVASVSSTGLITANHVGKTYIDINNERTIQVTVSPLYTQYTEPTILFGATPQEVISKMGSNYTISDESAIAYVPENSRIKAYMYMLNNGRVSSICMVTDLMYLETVTGFLKERYQPVTVLDNKYTALFINSLKVEDATLIVGEHLSTDGNIYIIYMPAEQTKSSFAIKAFDATLFFQSINTIVANCI